ncbi:MAG: ectoine synthase, partial [Paracoccaceae bacterium]
MIVRDFEDLKNTNRTVSNANWTSVRMLLAEDGMGFSFHITFLEAGSEHTFHYKHHFESV